MNVIEKKIIIPSEPLMQVKNQYISQHNFTRVLPINCRDSLDENETKHDHIFNYA